jgi:enoyl-[acyl-carrier protein] reductase / trans-2-enoyl-CoA reductase (NAD+)
MIIAKKITGNVSRSAHPIGCKQAVLEQINYVKTQGEFEGPKKVLILGASSSYGLASRIALAFGCHADTIGVSFERGIFSEEKLATAGWWNNIFFKQEAEKQGLIAKNFIADAFTDETRDAVIRYIKEEFGGKIDLLIYSLAAPRRKDPATGDVYSSVIKPIDETFRGLNINLETGELFDQQIEPATEDEINQTVKVMGGEDWELWVRALHQEDVMAEGFKTTLYSYIGPEVTQPIYGKGTLGCAKRHAEDTSEKLNTFLQDVVNGECIVSSSKAVTTKASAVIPTFPLYASALYKVMVEKGLHETPIMHKVRFFRDMLYGSKREIDEVGRLRPDNWEMSDDVQSEVKTIMDQITQENFKDLTAFDLFREEFLQINGFNVDGVDYEIDLDLEELKQLQP